KHLFEMRHQPTLVDRVPREAAAEVVVDAAFGDMFEGQYDGVEKPRFAGALPGSPEKFEQHRLREFGRPARAVVDRIDAPGELLAGTVELAAPNHDAVLRPRALGEALHQGAAVVLDAVRIVAENSRDVVQDVYECRFAVTALFRKICSAPERL